MGELNSGIAKRSHRNMSDAVEQVAGSASSAVANKPIEASSDTPPASPPGPWLKWIMGVLKTTPELLAERHTNPWFALFLSLCFPSIVAGMLVCVLGWGTKWHPFWYFVLTVYTLNIFWAPFFLRFKEKTIMSQFGTKFWCQTIMSLAILCYIVGMMLSGTNKLFDAWLPFGDVSLTALASYFQVPSMIISEHVLFVHSPRPTGTVLSVLGMYVLLGTRLEEARSDIVFGSRMVNSAQAGHCPYRGRIACLPHVLVAVTIIVASAIDYITESVEVHALGSIAPHLPLAVKQFRANIIKMTCEVITAAAILFFVFSGMDEYSLIAATGETPTFEQAEMRRYAYMCIGTTVLAISHVMFMMLVPDSAWARVQLRAQDAVRSAARRLSCAPGHMRKDPGAAIAHCRRGQVAPGDGAAGAAVAVDVGHGELVAVDGGCGEA